MNIAIAGAGLVGRLAALACLERGWEVTLWDRDTPEGHQSAAWAAAGMLAPYTEAAQGEAAILPFALRSMAQWPTLLQKLSQPVYWQQAGTLIVAHTQDRNDLLHFHNLVKNKIKDEGNYQWLNKPALTELEPNLSSTFQEALYLPKEAQVCPHELFPSLAHHLIKHSVTWHSEQTIEKIEPRTIWVNQKKHVYDWVIDCRGLGAKQDLPQLRGVRGELIWLHAPEVSLFRPIRLMHPRYTIYIVPRPNHQFVIGATSIESEDMSPISVQSLLELLSATYSLHRGFAEARVTATYTQCRPAFPDNLPHIYHEPGLTRINGLYRHGYLLAPAIVEDALAKIG